jgi:serine/threonine protein kinase/tetratricopeptide (TPR) repeat protein
MTPEQWQKIRPILESALELAPAARPAFLDDACPDVAVRHEVESLIASPGLRSSFLESPAVAQVVPIESTASVSVWTAGMRLGPYEVKSLLDAGGMGEVYRARDTRLNRTVAIKVLPRHLSSDPARRQRLEREARAIAALQHANICTLFDIGHQDGTDYLVMEYLEGETLSARLSKGPLPLDNILRYGIEVADALDTAHRCGIVHRDLKPGNIMVTAHGECKVLDFGLAMLSEEQPSSEATTVTRHEALTNPGQALGTVAYMSPEQARGEPLDSRTDIFSLGAVLYEMATGKMAFAGKTSAVIFKAILDETPAPPTQINAQLPERTDEIVAKALAKDRNLRYQSAAEVCTDLTRLKGDSASDRHKLSESGRAISGRKRLRGWWAVAALLTIAIVGAIVWWLVSQKMFHRDSVLIRSLAVLPLENLSGDPSQDYFADGMTELMITDLDNVGIPRVISRTSVMQYKGTRKPMPQIARELAVDGVLEAAVFRSGQRIRVTAKLIYAPADRQIWAETYDRDARDVMILQSDLARAIADAIKLKLTANTQSKLAKARQIDPTVNDAYLRGRYLWLQRTNESLAKAKQYFEQAIQKDPSFAPAYSGLADVYFDLGYAWGKMPPREAIPLARTAALKALELDETSAEAHTSLGFVKFMYDWDFSAAETEFRRAIALNPNYVSAHSIYSILLAAMGRPEEALAEERIAQAIDPLSVPEGNLLAGMLLNAGRRDEAIQQDLKTLELDPNNTHLTMIHGRLSRCYRQMGMRQQAIEEDLKDRIAQGASPSDVQQIRELYATRGRAGVLERDIRAALARWNKDRWHVDAFAIAWLYGDLGNNDQAFAWLEKAIQLRSTVLIWVLIDPPGSVRTDPRLGRVKQEMGIEK